MSISTTTKAIKKWLVVFFCMFSLACMCDRVYASGGYVVDPVITVPANSYTTFSTVYNGKRYYLGVDTTAAKSGKDTVMMYDEPCYAAMWIAGPMWSPTGAILPNKDYTRTVKSVWLAERDDKYTHKCFLSVGPDNKNYSPLILTDTANSSLWHTAKDFTVQSQQMHGFVYYYSDENGIETYRYFSYDPVYGFGRLYATRPTVSQRISVWDRHQGPDITCTLTPSTHTFGLNLTEDTVKLPITSRVYFYEHVDRFRSRYNQMDVFASATDPIYDQETLIEAPYNLYGFYEWKSNPRPRSVAHPTEPRNPQNAATDGGAYTYDGKSKMSLYGVASMSCEDPAHPTEETCHPVYGKIDSTMLWVSDLKYDLDEEADLWYDTIFAIGQSMYDVHEAVWNADESKWEEGAYKDHSDWLRQHFYIDGNHFVDSIQVNRRTFLNARHTSITLRTTPADAVFNYSYDNKDADGKAIAEADTAVTFTVIGDYESVTDILYINNAIATTIVDEGEGEDDLDIAHMPAFKVDEVWYDTLIVEALMPDGQSAIVGAEGASDKAWIESVRLIGRDKIRVKIAQFDETESNRTAQIRFTYRYYHSDIAGDVATATRSIWITKKKKSASSAELYSFSHKSGKGNLDGSGNETTGISTPQPVHTKKYTLYAIPGEGLQLPLHRDYWGYYRWYKWAGNTIANEHDIENTSTWSWTKRPKNQLKNDYMPINPATDNSSRGQWDIIDYNNTFGTDEHFVPGTQTSVPAVRYPSGVAASTTLKDTFACDVSAYTDIATTGTINVNLSALTEPTLSYRNIFYVRPAVEQAEKMSHCRVNGDEGTDDKWMEEREVLVPAGRAFSLHPQYPVLNGEHDVVEESLLQYIYYFNPAATGSVDTCMGLKAADRDDKTAACYGRIGKPSYTGTLSTTILDATTLGNMAVGQTKTILLVNPGKRSGYVMGSVAQSDKVSFGSFDGVVTNAADLKNMLDRYYVNAAAFVMVLTKTEAASEGNLGKFTIYCKRTAGNKPRYLTAYWAWNYWYTVRFPEPISTNTYTRDITISAPFTIDAGTSTERINTADTYVADASNLFRLYMYEDGLHSGNIGAHSNYNSSTDTYSDSDEEVELYSTSSLPGKTVNGAWCMYEITDRTEHTETPIWEYSSDGSSWTKVAEEGTNTSQYEMLSDGSLKVKSTVHTTPNAYAGYYRLRTEHFQLAKFAVWNTNPTTDGPSNAALVKEEDIHNHYDILFTFGTENFAAPNTENDTAYNHHMPWSFSELSYHYPEAVIGASDRVDGASLLPMKGEYAYINKFVDPTNPSHEIESMSGARYGYMLCIHTPEKPANFFQFEYPEIPCADQELFLTANICNPIADNGYNPEITADLEGTKDGGATWELIYRYKTGEIPYNAERPWYQIVLPIKQDAISGYQKFRCTASTHSTMADNAYMLIDRVRFIAKARPLSVFQNKTTCLAANQIDIVARLDYQNSTFGEGKLVAYQYQKKVGNSYVALPTTGVGSVTYVKDTLPETDLGYGVLRIPAKDFNPAEGPSSAYIRPIGGVTSTTRSYVNEAASGDPYWTMYISQKVSATANDTFRVAMSIMTKETAPDFAGSRCATERILGVKKPVVLYVDGSEWTAVRSAANVAANNTYRVQAVLTDAVLPAAARDRSGTCKFDILRSTETVDYNTLIAAWQAAMASGVAEAITTTKAAVDAADAAFTAEYGVNHSDLLDYLEIFRNLESPHAETTNWNEVHPLDFTYSGRSEDESRKIYNALNKLIAQDHKLQIGVDFHDVFLGSNQNIYYHLHPIPASGRYIVDATGKEAEIEVCNSPIWFEMHSASSNYELRLGLDHIVNGNYEVPVIRASKTDANTSLKVRVAEITNTRSELSVIGWNKTELVETNDPTWNATAVGSRIFKYNTNKKVYKTTPSSYYSTSTADSIITFTPAAGNNYACGLRAGYWYTFDAPFYGVSPTAAYPADDNPETLAGHARFILAVAPDTVRWTPSHNESANYWNDDNNWTPVMATMPADGFKATVPMNATKVIIPQVEEGLLPIVADLVVEQKDTLDYGYASNTCQKILFKPNAQMLGQEKLNYTNAFVDVHFKTGEWQTFSPALEDIYAGDMYIPFSTSYNPNDPSTGTSVDTVDFETKPFPYTSGYAGTYNPREWPFAFYQGFYNAAVPVPFYNTDTEDHALTNDSAKSKSAVDWVKTPSLEMHYAPGAPCVIQGFDATNEDGRDIIVRLPKTETTYYGYGRASENIYASGMSVTLPDRSADHNLAYDKTTLGAAEGISYTLRNATPADLFFFGNPTMALVDVYKLCVDNAGVLKHVGSNYYFTAYQLVDGSNYTTRTITGPGQYFIAPQRAIGLIAKEAAESLTIQLKPSALVAITGDGIVVSNPEIVDEGAKRAARARTVYEEPEKKWLYITASNETDWGVKKTYLTLGEQSDASRGYVFGEDALNIASGLNYYSDESFSTPLSLYTIADNQALMQDVRDTLVSVPLVFTTLPEYTYDEYTVLSFSKEGAWDKPLYLYDALTNDSIMILNGLRVTIETPQSDQIRYFINGRQVAQTENPGVATDLEQDEVMYDNASQNSVNTTIIYDLLGRRITTLKAYDLLSNIQLPTGVYIIQRGNHTERMVIR